MNDPSSTLMFREAAEAADACRRQRARNAAALAALGERLRAQPPRAVVTLARGSSDNAATYGRYLLETQARVLTSSLAPSVASVYDAPPQLAGTLLLAISQSGGSPDLVAAADSARRAGALVVALVNAEASPLAAAADIVLPLAAGEEQSVAATKSFIASLHALAALVAAWTGDAVLGEALDQLPAGLEQAWALDWSAADKVLRDARNLYVVGRGPGYGVAQEAALKIKETCGFHAEAFSAAEVRHGPMALAETGFPVLLFGQDDESRDSVADLAPLFAARGARVMGAGVPAPIMLPVVSAHALLEPILLIQSFYRLANRVALLRGRDPDRPPHLRKVTETL
jgi:glucosamine--fructose-6-phosphate aminotransferase (isomerizing)